MIGKKGTNGTRKPRSRSGRVRRSTMTPTLQITKANSVPMLTSTTISVERHDRGEGGDEDAEHAGDDAPACGVRGWTLRDERGSSPSRHIANKMRVWPYRIVSTTLVIATSAPTEITSAPQSKPAPSLSTVGQRRLGAGELVERQRAGRDDRDEDVEQRAIASETMIAIGRSRPGFLTSSPEVEIASKPM